MEKRPSVHLIGFAGIGMRGITRLFLQAGWRVSGSERMTHPEVENEFKAMGFEVVDESESLDSRSPDFVVYSTAVDEDHPQRSWSSKRVLTYSENSLYKDFFNKPLVHRSQALAYFFHKSPKRVAVAGCHGKTTCSSWLSYILGNAKDASYCVGGIVKGLEKTANLDEGDTFVIEADESDGSMVAYKSTHLLITNLDEDHMSYWNKAENLFQAMYDFAKSADQLILCRDDVRLKEWPLKAITYGFSSDADMKITSFQSHEGGSDIALEFKGRSLGIFHSKLLGAHNAVNLAGVISTLIALKEDFQALRPWIESFDGPKRRLERLGKSGNVIWYDDYAHHPVEIQATLKALKEAMPTKRIRVIFQPHRATRLRDFFDEFALSFKDVDELWIPPVYLAGESPIEGFDTKALAKKIQEKTKKTPRAFTSLEELKNAVNSDMSCDICLTMGAGDITYLGRRQTGIKEAYL